VGVDDLGEASVPHPAMQITIKAAMRRRIDILYLFLTSRGVEPTLVISWEK
jgi:hypothetical protein